MTQGVRESASLARFALSIALRAEETYDSRRAARCMHADCVHLQCRGVRKPRQLGEEKTMLSTPFVRPFLALALVLTTTGIASARQPPALGELQEQTHRLLATCPEAPAASGYRDMWTRFQSSSAPDAAPIAVARLRVRDHLVLKCAGGDVHESGGYRDMLVRFFQKSAELQVARAGRCIAQ